MENICSTCILEVECGGSLALFSFVNINFPFILILKDAHSCLVGVSKNICNMIISKNIPGHTFKLTWETQLKGFNFS